MSSDQDKSASMSDTVFAQYAIKEAFPKERYGSVKAAQTAAYNFVKQQVAKELTYRRIRSLWEGKVRRVDGEEKDALRKAKIEEARREQIELRARLARLDAALAVIDEDFHGPQMAAYREASRGLGGDHLSGTSRD